MTRRDGFPVEPGMTAGRDVAAVSGIPHAPVIPAKAGIQLSLPQAAFGLALI